MIKATESNEGVKQVNVIGAGVIGLTCSLFLARHGYKVTVIARDLPEDVESTAFASPWAGAFWHSMVPKDSKDSRLIEWDRKTYHYLWNLAKTELSIVNVVDTWDYGLKGQESIDPTTSWFYKSLCYDAREMTEQEIKQHPDAIRGAVYKTTSFNPHRYISYLKRLCEATGKVTFLRHALSCLDEAFGPVQASDQSVSSEDGNSIPTCQVVVNASGLGSLSLIGVEDKFVEPIHGQTILIQPPQPLFYTMMDTSDHYIISRPSSLSGDPGAEVILGGCFLPQNWNMAPSPTLAKEILEIAFKVCPQLSHDGTVEGIRILRHNVGLRPGRRGGPRVERQDVNLPTQSNLLPSRFKSLTPRQGTVVHAYGLAGTGFQASWGLAEDVLALVNESVI